ncbi:polysaccharide biosynthesis protein [Pedobacter sp. Leaf250]|uniref:polysaccharide biosynthesis protein n=1 Tax=Pedobacter sp. Leaf250 TaxID=2876559 RepID=UPI001E592C57|nr:polysaccharide biosynthesis protein [Pedobacter sp. Leaf250]
MGYQYFMTIPEAFRLVLKAGNVGNSSEIFIFDMGKSEQIVELAKKMIRLAGLLPTKILKSFTVDQDQAENHWRTFD